MVASNHFYPHAFRWQGRTVRVLAVEGLKTLGAERRFRLATAEGHFDLGLFTDSGAWCLRREPGWLGRAWMRWWPFHRQPRFPLPFWRRRTRRRAVVAAPAHRATRVPAGGFYADRLALVRQ